MSSHPKPLEVAGPPSQNGSQYMALMRSRGQPILPPEILKDIWHCLMEESTPPPFLGTQQRPTESHSEWQSRIRRLSQETGCNYSVEIHLNTDLMREDDFYKAKQFIIPKAKNSVGFRICKHSRFESFRAIVGRVVVFPGIGGAQEKEKTAKEGGHKLSKTNEQERAAGVNRSEEKKQQRIVKDEEVRTLISEIMERGTTWAICDVSWQPLPLSHAWYHWYSFYLRPNHHEAASHARLLHDLTKDMDLSSTRGLRHVWMDAECEHRPLELEFLTGLLETSTETLQWFWTVCSDHIGRESYRSASCRSARY